MNEFLWESTTPTHFLEYLADDYQTDVILATHTGIKWHRPLGPWRVVGGGWRDQPPTTRHPPPTTACDRHFVNVGVLGRPENDGQAIVWYAILEAKPHFRVEFIPVAYDHQRLAREMRDERLPEEFVETILTGWWTTCLEVLPAKERRFGKW